MTADNCSIWKHRLLTAIKRNNDSELRQALHSLRRVPGFHESRRQAYELEAYAKAQWSRFQRSPWPYKGVFVG